MQQKAINNAIGILKQEFPDNCYLNEVLAPYTSYKVGGPADALIIPKNVADLEYIIRYCIQNQLPYFILGKGANILVHDDGFRGLAVLLERCCHQLFHQNNLLYVGAGVTVQALVEYCEEHNLGGLEYMSGIPGTVGGALTMNAGAFVGEIGDRVLRIDALNAKGKRVELHKDEALFGYRQAEGLKNQVLLGCWLSVDKGDRAALAAAREGYLQRRAAKQPLDHPSCGSVFKRPPGDYAGRLVEAAGCKGFTIGGAMVSPKHANFIVNYNQAIASDIYEVIRQVQQKVYDLFKVWLELEVKLIGFSKEARQKVEAPDNAA